MKTVPTDAASSDIIGPDVIYKQVDRYLVMSDILPLYSSTSGSIVIVSDEYTGYGDIPNLYDVVLGVENQTYTKSIIISVRQTIGDVIAVSKTGDLYTIHVNKDVTLSTTNIREILQNIQMIQVSSTTILQEITNTYKVNQNSPGNYIFEFRLISLNGIEEFHTINIRVSNTNQLVPDDLIEPSPRPTQSFRGFIYTIGFISILIVGVLFIQKKRKKRG